ncbi:clathrin heavy chain linker domain-containing protein 1 isoform X1 [Archocentrus centrarchus]|uniref:clathrin heavy chain linker domain-containing protein 1 isoform X1 n=1 Tax=Archocentrus centrarchus TaxID=63155 RepID=UPI0011EA0264|nr:clathrin heavy chain linker domain-containing protein 1 isoform X1 [Archocentrus centrarchus]XP_030604249.1 clathrin heavy chain linker domain-containing protein 1 isoform X1 [Archocentrus centrarchus]
MSAAQTPRGPSSGRRFTAGIRTSDSDRRFLEALHQFIEREKKHLRCPEEGADELRYTVHRSAFNQVIGQVTAYKRLLVAIKLEYDDTIRELQRREEEARATRRTTAASESRLKSLLTCQRRAAHLRDRISSLQRETAELQEDIKREKTSKEQSTWMPGLTVAESENPEALERYLRDLEAQRGALLDRKSQCVPLEVKTKLDAELQAAEHRRDRLSAENDRLTVLYKRLKCVWDCLSSWEEEGQQVPLQELLGSTLENIRQADEMDEDTCGIKQLFEDQEPTGVDSSKLLADYLDRFLELFDSAQYEDAALIAARAPRGVLSNTDTMEMFKGVEGFQGLLPPPFLFFWALLFTASADAKLSAPLSLQGISCALQCGALQLVTYAVTQKKLTFSEDLGDILTEHAQKNPGVADLCLTLATIVYEACRLNRKVALSMCRRGLIHSAAEFLNHCEDLTAEDCMWVLCHSPSLSLLQLLTEPPQDGAAILSVGVACAVLLVDPQQQLLALQLLDSFMTRGREGLEEVIMGDCGASVDVWTDVVSLCSELKRDDLSRTVLSILLSQSGTRIVSPDPDGARLVEHIYL